MSAAGERVVGIDIGTQSVKALAIDPSGACVRARASVALDMIAGLPAGHAEQHPDSWLHACERALGGLWDQGVNAAEVVAVGVSGQQHGLVVLDDEGAVVRPAKLWCDTSTATEAAELSERIGRAVPAGFTASKVLWLARHEADAWARTRHVLLPHDYANWALTGEHSMEAGDASGTGWFDPVARRFDAAAMDAIDPELAARLPELRAADAWAGRVTATAARRFGLAEGTPVSMGGGDNMMSAVGSGAAEPGVVVVSLGTSGTVFARTDWPVVDPDGGIAPFCGSVGGWLPLLCVMNLTGVTEEVIACSGLDHASLTKAAGGVEAGCRGLLWIPFLNGERVPDLPEATGTLLGMRPGHLRPEVLYRAALEGTSLNLAWGVDRMRALGVEVDRVHLVGGAAKNPLWRQILADCLGAEVQALAEPESAALGAGLQALWALRRARGEAVDAATVAAPFVRTEGSATTPSADAASYAVLGKRFRAEVARVS